MDKDILQKRIEKTLKITEERGYNLTKKKLSEQLIGGKISINQLELTINSMKNIVSDDVYVSTKKNSYFKKCKERKEKNDQLNRTFLSIAKEFVDDYVKICPWVYCVMLTGSVASEGVCEDDDIDFNFVVNDGTKYISYLIAIILSFKYSLKYKKLFNYKYLGFISKVICVSVIWEKNQIFPFTRRDEQIAYEMLSVRILYNLDFFRKILHNNSWISNFFPQIIEKNGFKLDKEADNFIISEKKRWPKIFENLTFTLMYFANKIIIYSRLRNLDLKNRVNLVEKAKHPYGIFDVPE